MKKQTKDIWYVFKSDDDGHNYLIPVTMSELFDELLYEQDDDDTGDKFNRKFYKYRISSSGHYKFLNPTLIVDEEDEG